MAATTGYSASNATAHGSLSLVEDLRQRFVRYRMYRRTLNELSALNNRELADLGLHRSTLRRVAYQAACEARA